MSGMLVIVSGPSAVGKDTLLERWKQTDDRVCRVVTYTTRAPRAGEVDGSDYHFVSRAEFEKMAGEGAFLEAKEVHGNLYGSPVRETDLAVAEGKLAVLKIDVQGALDVMRQRPDAATVFVLPPSLEELERRMRGRDLDSEDDVRTRLKNARWELDQAVAYRFGIVNDELESAVAELSRAVAAAEAGPAPTATGSSAGGDLDESAQVPSGASALGTRDRMPKSGAARFAGLLVFGVYGVLGAVIIGAILIPLLSRANTGAREKQTLLDIRRLGAAVLLYATDNDNHLPPDMSSAEAARKAVRRYVSDERAFATLNPRGGEFVGNRALSGIGFKPDDPNLGRTVMFYESRAWPDGSRAVVWLDGHEMMVRGFDPALRPSP